MEKNAVRVGFSRADITPLESVPLAGYGNTERRMSGAILSRLYATCLAFSDGENKALLISLDNAGFSDLSDEVLRPAIAEATGIPVSCIHLSCSHTHSASDVGKTDIPSVRRLCKQLEARLVLAAVEALQDLSYARIFAGTYETTGLNFVRQFVRADGTYCGSNFGNLSDSPIVGYESEADRMLQLVYFLREGRQNVILANFQGHPHRFGGGKDPTVTADVAAFFRDELERRTGCLVSYITGASGNQNSSSRIKEDMLAKHPCDHGKLLANEAFSTFRYMREVSAEGVGAVSLELELPLNHTEDHLAPQAEKIKALWLEHNDSRLCAQAGEPYGIHSPYHATAIIRKAGLPNSFTFTIHALKVGGIGIAIVPYEMYDTNGVQIKKGSPFDLTVIATCANTMQGYVPSRLAWEHGGYSCDTTRFCPGSGEELAEHYLTLLQRLHKGE